MLLSAVSKVRFCSSASFTKAASLSSRLLRCKMSCTSRRCHAGISPCTETQHLSSSAPLRAPGLPDTGGRRLGSATPGCHRSRTRRRFPAQRRPNELRSHFDAFVSRQNILTVKKQTAEASKKNCLNKYTYDDLNPEVSRGKRSHTDEPKEKVPAGHVVAWKSVNSRLKQHINRADRRRFAAAKRRATLRSIC